MTAQRCTKIRDLVLASHRIRSIARFVAAGLVVTAWCFLPTGRGFLPAAYAQQLRLAPESPGPDARYKADILLVVAHPDDETMVTAYLAKAVFDDHKRVAVIYGTRGDGGGNAEGYEEAAALGAVREIEGRRALAYLGIVNVWFLNGPDTPGQDVLRSLETWNHGATLDQVVRLVRLTRPEIILTWLPDYVAGENHDDHQAAGVIATEAFDLAGNATVFPEQLAAPRNRYSVANLTEGLHPWQPEKIYYFSDASHTDFLEGQGPKYETTDVSPSRHVPYYRLAAESMAFHLTQGDTGQMAKQALAKGDFRYFEQPIRLILGKSLVKSTSTGEIFAGVVPRPLAYAPPHGYQPQPGSGLSVELGGPWSFYREFWRAHNLDHLAGLLPQPEVEVVSGTDLHIPLLIHNGTDSPAEVAVTFSVPAGWKEVTGSARYPARAHDAYPVQAFFTSPAKAEGAWQEISWIAEAAGRKVAEGKLRVHLASGGLPQ